jgi:hypothetical protein
LGEDNDDEIFLFVSDKILISDRSSLIMDECPCTNGFVDE